MFPCFQKIQTHDLQMKTLFYWNVQASNPKMITTCKERRKAICFSLLIDVKKFQTNEGEKNGEKQHLVYLSVNKLSEWVF